MSKRTRCKDCHKFMTTVWDCVQVSAEGDFERVSVVDESVCHVCVDNYLPID